MARDSVGGNGVNACIRLLFLAAFGGGAIAAAQDERGEFVSDMVDRLRMTVAQGWGSLGMNTAVVPPGAAAGTPLRFGDKEYAKGLGHHAPGEIAIDCAGKFLDFECRAGVHWQGGKRGSVVLQAIVDGKIVFESGVLTDSDAPVPVKVALAGAKTLVLVAKDAGDGIECDAVDWVEARLVRDRAAPDIGRMRITLDGVVASPPRAGAFGFTMLAVGSRPQAALAGVPPELLVCVRALEIVEAALPVEVAAEALAVSVDVHAQSAARAEVVLALDDGEARAVVNPGEPRRLRAAARGAASSHVVRLRVRGIEGEALVRVAGLTLEVGARSFPIEPQCEEGNAPLSLPAARDAVARAMVEWDWRMQDGIDTPREKSDFLAAAVRTLERCEALVAALGEAGTRLPEESARAAALARRAQSLAVADGGDVGAREQLWRDAHELRRRVLLAHPRAACGPIAFVKSAPGVFSHQLTQYYGRYARPGGGIFVLERPGESMQCRELTAGLPQGSCQHLDVSFEGDRLLFAFCEVPTAPRQSIEGEHGRYFHLYETTAAGGGPRRLTDGAFDDFAPRYLPNGKIVFISTRRQGWHRCGYPGCENYTLALAEADGANPRTVSYHETQEWDPAVLNDGRIVYTRWDYVDRHAVYYEQLWSVHPDGSMPSAYYGNNTFNPVGIWEARALPGSTRVIATAGAHHAMTAGSIIFVDVGRGVDGAPPIQRLTPDALFPESETPVGPASWYAPAGIAAPPPVPPEERRWPGHCYRSPYPLSEDLFLVAYSFEALLGEPTANAVNMWGLYLCDRFGNKELLYRDPAIASLWPMPLAPRARPPVVADVAVAGAPHEGVFVLQDVYASAPGLPRGSVKRLRIVQVLPKSTPGANRPTVGLANASPGKQVLGTVPVEADGSAFFRAPAGLALSFQALDAQGRALQVMRSVTYLQAGEQAACIGCHEARTATPRAGGRALALARGPSAIVPAPEGARPLSYPLLVQPVLDRRCVSCHGGDDPAGKLALTGAPEGRYTVSYNALAPRVSFSAWGGKDGDFRLVNSEPLSTPGFFGARGSSLMRLLEAKHGGVTLEGEDLERIVTWMDANALFYGTFEPEAQARQQRGERIAGPGLE